MCIVRRSYSGYYPRLWSGKPEFDSPTPQHFFLSSDIAQLHSCQTLVRFWISSVKTDGPIHSDFERCCLTANLAWIGKDGKLIRYCIGTFFLAFSESFLNLISKILYGFALLTSIVSLSKDYKTQLIAWVCKCDLLKH